MSGKMRSTPGKLGPGEGDAEIDDDPGAVVGRAVAVEAEIHADLADAAERQEDQFVATRPCDMRPSPSAAEEARRRR